MLKFITGPLTSFLRGRPHLPEILKARSILNVLAFIFWESIGIAITTAVSFLLCLGLLYLGKAFWYVYSETQLGQSYGALFHDKTIELEKFFAHDLMDVSANLTIEILGLGLLVSVAAQITFLRMLFYYPLGVVGKLAYWLIPFAGSVSFLAQRLYGYQWLEVLCACIISSALMLGTLMELVPRILPDGLLFRAVFRVIMELYYLIERNLSGIFKKDSTK